VILADQRITLRETMTRASATINGHELAYSLHGERHRPVVVLSHALATSMDIWAYQLPLLAHRFRVLRYDLRGHGSSSAAPGNTYTLQELASDVAALLDLLQIERAAFVGISIGAMIGQVFALQYPDKLSGLVLCSTGSRTEPQAKTTIEDRIHKVLAQGLESQVQATLTRWFSSKFVEETPATDALSEVRVKTLIVPGEFDLGSPEKVARVIQQKIANSDLILLKGAAHLGNVEQAHRFNEILLGFLGRIPT